MFDTYIPDPPLKCPVCGETLESWQGKDGDCLLLTWKQGQKFPLKHGWPEECVEDEITFLESRTLPSVFEFRTSGCKCDRTISAYGFCENGIWVRSEFVTPANFRPGSQTSVKDEHKIKRDLERWLESKNTDTTPGI